ncbi:MAG: UPF0182 family protein, partial [Vulcanococcus sp.]|nr:UPF0182 family protein [Vulcanococcus sp.]
MRLSVDALKRGLRWLGWLAIGLGLLVLVPRLVIEAQWFGQFQSQSVVLRRWLFQLLAFALVFGLGVPLQLQQLQRCWLLRQQVSRKTLPASPLVPLGPPLLVGLFVGLLLLLAGGLTYLMVQAGDLIAAPFSGDVITGIPVLADLPPLLFIGLGAALLPLLLLWPYTSLRVALAAALAGSATAVARGWSLWLP